MKIKTTLLKIVTLIIDAFVLFFIVMLSMSMLNAIQDHPFDLFPTIAGSTFLIVGLLVLVISYYFFRIFKLIDNHNFFTQQALHFVKMVRYLFIACSIVLLAILPIAYQAADIDDAPGLIIVALGFIFFPSAIAAFISVMEKILINSIQFKQENELTI